jgi:hypothetical protein
MIRPAWLILLPLLAIGACSDEPPAAPPDQRDPAIARALDDPLMTDPDLSSRNEAAAAITVETDTGLPVLTPTPDDAAAARAEAARMVGGAEKLTPLPTASSTMVSLPEGGGPAEHLSTLLTDPKCRAGLRESAVWAASMPAALPVYPRGALQHGAGRDDAGCHVRALAFTAAVTVQDVMAFYARRAAMAGMTAVHGTDGSGEVLRGTGEGIAYDIRAQAAGDGTLVKLAVALR